MTVLTSPLRRQLETSVLAARRHAESASRAAIEGLGVFADKRPDHLNADQADIRNGLRAKWRQLSGARELLVAECAYEQWHRLLFARFLAENNLLLHPQYKAAITLADCEELASDLGEPDGWSVAARFAAEILPGIFRVDDPCIQLRLAPEGRHALEQVLDSLPVETFLADDALGWVYQFWQQDSKDEVNASERKVGGSDIGPVTQLFTDSYMVRFLLQNSLGSWWVSRHPNSALGKGFEYLRHGSDGRPVVGSFNGWPDKIAAITVMDPCCGSGHFLVEAFSMLWRMRAEEEGVSAVEAQDAVLRENLFGLELDPRCVQIAMFAVVLQAWKAGGGWRQVPVPNIACSGVPVRTPVAEWTQLARGDQRLEHALGRLHVLFSDADTLGSLIDPRRAAEESDQRGTQGSFNDVDWAVVFPLLEKAVRRDDGDPAALVMGVNAVGLTKVARLLSSRYTLIATNPPYLARGKQSEKLRAFIDARYSEANADLATVFLQRCRSMLVPGGSDATVTPQNWLFLGSYRRFRESALVDRTWNALARVGLGATSTKSWDTLRALLVSTRTAPDVAHLVVTIDAFTADDDGRADDLRDGKVRVFRQATQLSNPASIVSTVERQDSPKLGEFAISPQGIKTGDDGRHRQMFWEQERIEAPWRRYQSTVSYTADFGGCEMIVRWEENGSNLARPQGQAVWQRQGVMVSMMRSLPVCRYLGEAFDSNVGVLAPRSPEDLAAIWAFAASDEYNAQVREIDPGLRVVNASLLRVPFDRARWAAVVAQQFPDGLPEPTTADPTQWLFDGRPERSIAALQVGVARLVGYRWPGQTEPDGLESFVDDDGIACLPSVAGEAPAAERVQQMLAGAFGDKWSPALAKALLEQAGSTKRNLAEWLRDEFFKNHCALFGNRPFVWQIWDGQQNGFSALVNYHRLNRKRLEKLTYTYLGTDWVERQRAEIRDQVPGADRRLVAALSLQRKLEAILEGEMGLDVYVRWKDVRQQSIGWDPDFDDGVRLNIRPFVLAGVLRAPLSIRWNKDRGTNTDGSERRNDVYLTVAAKLEARERHDRT